MKKLIHFSLSLIIALTIFSCGDNSTTPSNDEALVSKLKGIADSVMANTHVPGMVIGIWAPNENLPSWIYTTGKADLVNNVNMNSNLLFRIGSNTKTFTVTVLLQLVDEKLVSLDDKLSRFFPEYPNADKITIEMLTDMTSGYFNYSATDEFTEILLQNPLKIWTHDELIDLGINHAPVAAPGDTFYYSNTNTAIIGKLIEKLTKNTLQNEIKKRITDKLGMTNTYLPVSGTDIIGDHIHGYYAEQYDSTNPDYSHKFDISWAWAAGAIVSNLYDMKNYVEHLVDGGLISDSLQQKRMTFTRYIMPYMQYGIGCYNKGGFIGHNGGLPGFTSIMLRDPVRNCTIVIFFNCQLLEPTPDALFMKLTKAIYPTLLWN